MNFFENCCEYIKKISNNEEYKKYEKMYKKYEKFIFLGNGGSNAIASHIAQDFVSKNKIALSFNDTSMMSCFSNDFKQENIFSTYLQHFADKNTFVVIISSSGNSSNIFNAIRYCEENQISYGILTGFDEKNKARSYNKLFCMFDYHVDSFNYGVVECVHQVFLHGIV